MVKVRLAGLKIARSRGKYYVYVRETGDALLKGFEGDKAALLKRLAMPDMLGAYNIRRKRDPKSYPKRRSAGWWRGFRTGRSARSIKTSQKSTKANYAPRLPISNRRMTTRSTPSHAGPVRGARPLRRGEMAGIRRQRNDRTVIHVRAGAQARQHDDQPGVRHPSASTSPTRTPTGSGGRKSGDRMEHAPDNQDPVHARPSSRLPRPEHLVRVSGRITSPTRALGCASAAPTRRTTSSIGCRRRPSLQAFLACDQGPDTDGPIALQAQTASRGNPRATTEAIPATWMAEAGKQGPGRTGPDPARPARDLRSEIKARELAPTTTKWPRRSAIATPAWAPTTPATSRTKSRSFGCS